VLEQELRRARPAGNRGAREQRRVALGIGKDVLACGGEDGFAVAPHARRERAAPYAPARVECRPQRVPTLGRRPVAQLQQPAAPRAHLPGEGGGGGAHAPASFSTSFRMPPAVTAGPAPGPVITSGFFL